MKAIVSEISKKLNTYVTVLKEKHMAKIYKITNNLNNKFYIGMIKNDNKTIEDRFKGHLKCLEPKSKSKSYLHNAIRKYGKENFKIELIEECSADIVQDREIYWIDCLSPDYNLTAGGDGGSTTHNYIWVTNNIENKYIRTTDEIPEGFERGRKCHFSDSEFQREMGARADVKKRGMQIKKAWDDGKFANRPQVGFTSENNPMNGPDAIRYKEKLSKKLTGRKHYNNGVIVKSLKQEDIQEAVKNGWVKGRIKRE